MLRPYQITTFIAVIAFVGVYTSQDELQLPSIKNPYEMMDYLMKNVTEEVENPYDYAEVAQIFLKELGTFNFGQFMKLLCKKPAKCSTLISRFKKPLPKDVEKAFKDYILVSKINANLERTCSQDTVRLLEELRARTLIMRDGKIYGSHEEDNWGKVDRNIGTILVLHGIQCQPIYESRFIAMEKKNPTSVKQAVELGQAVLVTLLDPEDDLTPAELDDHLSTVDEVAAVMDRLSAVPSEKFDRLVAGVADHIPTLSKDKGDVKRRLSKLCETVRQNLGPNLLDLVDYDYTYSSKIAKYEMKVNSLSYKYSWLGYEMCKSLAESTK